MVLEMGSMCHRGTSLGKKVERLINRKLHCAYCLVIRSVLEASDEMCLTFWNTLCHRNLRVGRAFREYVALFFKAE